MRYTIHEAKTNFSKLVAEAEAGEEVLIGRGRGEPTVKLVKLTGHPSRLHCHPELNGSIKRMNREALTQPLPVEEWGELGI